MFRKFHTPRKEHHNHPDDDLFLLSVNYVVKRWKTFSTFQKRNNNSNNTVSQSHSIINMEDLNSSASRRMKRPLPIPAEETQEKEWPDEDTASDNSSNSENGSRYPDDSSGEYSGATNNEHDTSTTSDDDDSSQNSIQRYKRYLFKYDKYLRDDDGQRQGENYEKYKTSLAKSREEQTRWVTPEKKLGAAPTLEIEYRYSTTSPVSPIDDAPSLSQPQQASDVSIQAKASKLESNVLDEEDLAIVRMMLEGEEDENDSGYNSLPSTESMEHIFADTPSSGGITIISNSTHNNNRNGDRIVKTEDEQNEKMEDVTKGNRGPNGEGGFGDDVSESQNEMGSISNRMEREFVEGITEENSPLLKLEEALEEEFNLPVAILDSGGLMLGDENDNRHEAASTTAANNDSQGKNFDALWEKNEDSESPMEDGTRNKPDEDDFVPITASDQDGEPQNDRSQLCSSLPQNLAHSVSSGSSSDPQPASQTNGSRESSGVELAAEQNTLIEIPNGYLPQTDVFVSSVPVEQVLTKEQMATSTHAIEDSSNHQSSTDASVLSEMNQPQDSVPSTEPKSQEENVLPNGDNSERSARDSSLAKQVFNGNALKGSDSASMGESKKSPEETSDKGDSSGDDQSLQFEDLLEDDLKAANENISLDEFSLQASQEFDDFEIDDENDGDAAFDYIPRSKHHPDVPQTKDPTSKQPPLHANEESGDIEAALEPPANGGKRPLPEEKGGIVRVFGRALIVFAILTMSVAPFCFLLWGSDFRDIDDSESAGQPTIPEDPTLSPAAPTLPPINATDSSLDSIRESFISLWPSLEEAFGDSLSPQYLAFQWLLTNSGIISFTEKKRIQRFVLAVFYFATNGDQWDQSDLWLTEEDECNWYSSNIFRARCNEEGDFNNLELYHNGISGTLPPELALLSSSLIRIDIVQEAESRSVLTGQLPSELGALTMLESINLGYNQLSGSLPREIGNWSRASSLDLKHNALVGDIPSEIGLLVALSFLNLEENAFTEIPSEIGNCQLLRDLDLSSNKLLSIPSEIGNLVVLRNLSVSNNVVQGSIPTEIGNLSALLSLDFANNMLRGDIPTEMGNLVAIRDNLDLSHNRLSGTIPSQLARAIFLRELYRTVLQYFQPLRLTLSNVSATIVARRYSRPKQQHSHWTKPCRTGLIVLFFVVIAVLRVDSNDLTGSVPDVVCADLRARVWDFCAQITLWSLLEALATTTSTFQGVESVLISIL
eukprot:scaffold1605_cov141-Cylindrotheca_fusiformis.AAC.2